MNNDETPFLPGMEPLLPKRDEKHNNLPEVPANSVDLVINKTEDELKAEAKKNEEREDYIRAHCPQCDLCGPRGCPKHQI